MPRSQVEVFVDLVEENGQSFYQDEIDSMRVVNLGGDNWGVYFEANDGEEVIVTKWLGTDWQFKPDYSGEDRATAQAVFFGFCG